MAYNQTLIVSNNSAVWKGFPKCNRVVGSPFDVMRRVRDLVHMGYHLRVHPLTGSIRLLRNPYRTVVLSYPETGVDSGDLLHLEEALWRLSQLDFGTTPESTFSDYQSIDLELLRAFFGEKTGGLRTGHNDWVIVGKKPWQ